MIINNSVFVNLIAPTLLLSVRYYDCLFFTFFLNYISAARVTLV